MRNKKKKSYNDAPTTLYRTYNDPIGYGSKKVYEIKKTPQTDMQAKSDQLFHLQYKNRLKNSFSCCLSTQECLIKIFAKHI